MYMYANRRPYEKRVAAVLRRTTMTRGRMDALALDVADDYMAMKWSGRSGDSERSIPILGEAPLG
jgi:hypothetical protein